MEAEISSENLVFTYRTTRCQISEVDNWTLTDRDKLATNITSEMSSDEYVFMKTADNNAGS